MSVVFRGGFRCQLDGLLLIPRVRCNIKGESRRCFEHQAASLHQPELDSDMTAKPLPTIEMLHKLFVCDTEAGTILWRERTPDMFTKGKNTTEHTCNKWNSQHAGKDALITVGKDGYKRGGILGKNYYAHRVIYKIHHGVEPIEIDHTNGKRDDNRIINLSSGTHQDNCRNMSISRINKSGVVGVSWIKKKNVWSASIGVDGKTVHIGYFDDKDSAQSARKFAEQNYGFKKTHGKHIELY